MRTTALSYIVTSIAVSLLFGINTGFAVWLAGGFVLAVFIIAPLLKWVKLSEAKKK